MMQENNLVEKLFLSMDKSLIVRCNAEADSHLPGFLSAIVALIERVLDGYDALFWSAAITLRRRGESRLGP